MRRQNSYWFLEEIVFARGEHKGCWCSWVGFDFGFFYNVVMLLLFMVPIHNDSTHHDSPVLLNRQYLYYSATTQYNNDKHIKI